MSAEVRTAVVNEALEISNMFKQNCALRHGLPEKPTKQQVGRLTPDPPVQVNVENKIPVPEVRIENNIPAAPAASNSPSPGATVAAETGKRSLVKTVAPWLLSAAAGFGVPPAYWWLTKGEEAPATSPDEPQDGLLLPWLEDQGRHLPEGTWPTK